METRLGSSDIPSIPGVSGFVASSTWNIKGEDELAPLEWNTLRVSPVK